MPTTMKCSQCGYIIHHHPTIPGLKGTRYLRVEDPVHQYADWYKLVSGRCPGCNRIMPKPSDYYEAMQCRVTAVEMSREQADRIRWLRGGRRAGNTNRYMKRFRKGAEK